jgi:predicted nucleic acid-binding protein
MTDLVFVDTNVLVYASDAGFPRKQDRAARWMTHLWHNRIGRLSYQVLQEFYATVTVKLRPGMDVRAAREEVRALMSWNPITVDEALVERAWAVQDRYGYACWDALIVAAAQLTGCRVLLTEDLQDGQALGEVRVLNPFKHGPKDI